MVARLRAGRASSVPTRAASPPTNPSADAEQAYCSGAVRRLAAHCLLGSMAAHRATAKPWQSWFALPTAFAAGLLLGGCLTPTPYGSDTERPQLNSTATQHLKTPHSAARFRFVALSDSHDAYDELGDAVTAINHMPDVDFVVHAGDVSDYGLAQEYEWNARALSGLRVPGFVVIGNHDAISNGKAVYRDLYGPFDFFLPLRSLQVRVLQLECSGVRRSGAGSRVVRDRAF